MLSWAGWPQRLRALEEVQSVFADSFALLVWTGLLILSIKLSETLSAQRRQRIRRLVGWGVAIWVGLYLADVLLVKHIKFVAEASFDYADDFPFYPGMLVSMVLESLAWIASMVVALETAMTTRRAP